MCTLKYLGECYLAHRNTLRTEDPVTRARGAPPSPSFDYFLQFDKRTAGVEQYLIPQRVKSKRIPDIASPDEYCIIHSIPYPSLALFFSISKLDHQHDLLSR